MPLIRKRRATQAEPPNDDDDAASSGPDLPPNRNNKSARRRGADNNDNESDAASDNDAGYNDPSIQAPDDGVDGMVKKMVRLALASEYSRQPIRRKDISTKVLGEQGTRQFKPVFEKAQKELRYRFGMEMVEQPAKANLGGFSQARATQRQTQSTSSTSNKSWTLTTILPTPYRTDTITPAPRAPSSSTESSYTALYTFIISLITLSGGSIPEQKLERYMRRANADSYTPIDRTELLIARLVKEGYLIKNRDTEGGEEVVEYFVGPRGKVEVGDLGVEGLAREVFGFLDVQGEGEGEGEGGVEREEFEGKLKRSLGLKEMAVKKDEGGTDAAAAAQEGGGRGRRGNGNRRGRRNADGDDDDEDFED